MSFPACYAVIEIESDGSVSISHWVDGDSTDLLVEDDSNGAKAVDDVELRLMINSDEGKATVHDGVQIELSKYHVTPRTPDDKETYSVVLKARLSWQDAERLHLFLGCLLNIHRAAIPSG